VPAVAAKPKAPPPAPAIIWRGDRATERAFVADLVKQYELGKHGKVTMQPFSTISGIDAVHDGSADIAGSARPAMPGRVEEAGMTFYPIAWEALVPITSPKNPVNDVSLYQLYQIYLGRMTSWKDLGGADEPINLYGVAGPLDGVEYSLRKLLYHRGDQEVGTPRWYLNTVKLEDGITIDPHGLGFTTMSAVYANKAIKMLTVEGFSASSASIADGSYPLYSVSYLAARDDGKNREAVEKFIKFANSDEGKAIVRKHQLVPYDDAPTLLAKQDERIAYIDARINPLPPSTTRVSAPVATADYLIRTQPNSVEAQEAKQRAAQAQAEMKAAKAADSKASGN
jgi:phosphate transport system substrate-binding protein